ncbi:integrating conjugative element protein [Halopseudomonas bauzanensis]|uniref:integrating conjugative element protein n=1 Tax=Halopseudomonas bauzanensis TaxID=653930 RepID=UPI003523549F
MKRRITLFFAVALLASSLTVSAADEVYYRIGGANPISIAASSGIPQSPALVNMGVRWNMDASCGNFDLGYSVSNSLNGVTNTFQNLMGNVIQNAQGAVASLPAMIIQRSYPQLYELLSNGVLQGRLDFDRGKLSCQNMAGQMGDWMMGSRLQQVAAGEAWSNAAATTRDPVQAQAQVEQTAGNDGVTWVGGSKRGGQGQEPINVVTDVVVAGYNLLHERSSLETQPISGGGTGWGAAPTNSGSWPGGGNQAGSVATAPGVCRGGMCTLWGTPEDAATWVTKVIGETRLQTCDNCERGAGRAGTGLIKDLEEEQQNILDILTQLLAGSLEINPENLRQVSGGEGLAVSRGVIEAIRADPDSELLAHRLASEMALSRTLIKAMWARRTLLAGMTEPAIAEVSASVQSPIAPALNQKFDSLDRDIDALKTELEIRTAMANNTAMIALERAAGRSEGASQAETFSPDSLFDSRGRPKPSPGTP